MEVERTRTMRSGQQELGAKPRAATKARGPASRRERLGTSTLAATALALCLCLCLAPPPAAGTPVLLQDGSALLTVDPDAPTGLTDWTVAGVQHLREQSFWLRPSGSGAEAPLSDLDRPGAAVVSDLDGDGSDDALGVTLVDPQGRFDVELRWSLAGSPIAPVTAGAASSLGLSLTLRNLAGAPLSLDLFQFTDVDLLGTFADDTILFSGSPPNTAAVTDASELAVYESVFTAAPDAVEAARFGELRPRLEDDAATTLDGRLSATGDVTAAAAWSLSLPAGGSFVLAQSQRIEVAGLQSIPEPGGAWLVGAGLAAIAGRGRRRRLRLVHPWRISQ